MKATIVTGLGYGDEGKGALVDYLVRTTGADTVVRFNGGSQAGHNVVLPARNVVLGAKVQTHHEFHQWGAGSLVEGVRTHLARPMLIDPERLFGELDDIGSRTGFNAQEMWRGLSIDHDAAIVTPFHRATNRIKEEMRGDGRHGSTGQGIWETQLDKRNGRSLTLGRVRSMTDDQLGIYLRAMQVRKRDELDVAEALRKLGPSHHLARDLYKSEVVDDLVLIYRVLSELATLTHGLPDMEVAVFEGAQGTLLSQEFGWHPYTTGSTTTSANARALIGEKHKWDGGKPEVTHIGCVRAYATRHGAGPFATESRDVNFPEPHNATGRWQGRWRQGHTDLVALKYAVDCDKASLDGIAVSHTDVVDPIDDWQMCVSYPHAQFKQDGQWRPGLNVPKDRSDQVMLTEAIKSAQPQYQTVHGRSIPAVISRVTNLPVLYVATGPTYEDRHAVDINYAVAA